MTASKRSPDVKKVLRATKEALNTWRPKRLILKQVTEDPATGEVKEVARFQYDLGDDVPPDAPHQQDGARSGFAFVEICERCVVLTGLSGLV